jgi:predicted nucleotidyltransferase component of viral defense system
MIDDEAIRERAATLSVPESQIRRDHVLSHLIHSLEGGSGFVFIGGTALNRTFLQDLRLSEDIDLYVLDGDRELILNQLLRGVRLEYPDLQSSGTGSVNDVHTFRLQDGPIQVRVQMIRNRPSWETLPTTVSGVRLYYADLPETAHLATPTCESLVAMKLNAWVDRSAPRDLFDLWKLTLLDCFNPESLELVTTMLARRLQRQEFHSPPSLAEWTAELSHQTSDPGSPEVALSQLAEHLADLGAW